MSSIWQTTTAERHAHWHRDIGARIYTTLEIRTEGTHREDPGVSKNESNVPEQLDLSTGVPILPVKKESGTSAAVRLKARKHPVPRRQANFWVAARLILPPDGLLPPANIVISAVGTGPAVAASGKRLLGRNFLKWNYSEEIQGRVICTLSAPRLRLGFRFLERVQSATYDQLAAPRVVQKQIGSEPILEPGWPDYEAVTDWLRTHNSGRQSGLMPQQKLPDLGKSKHASRVYSCAEWDYSRRPGQGSAAPRHQRLVLPAEPSQKRNVFPRSHTKSDYQMRQSAGSLPRKFPPARLRPTVGATRLKNTGAGKLLIGWRSRQYRCTIRTADVSTISALLGEFAARCGYANAGVLFLITHARAQPTHSVPFPRTGIAGELTGAIGLVCGKIKLMTRVLPLSVPVLGNETARYLSGCLQTGLFPMRDTIRAGQCSGVLKIGALNSRGDDAVHRSTADVGLRTPPTGNRRPGVLAFSDDDLKLSAIWLSPSTRPSPCGTPKSRLLCSKTNSQERVIPAVIGPPWRSPDAPRPFPRSRSEARRMNYHDRQAEASGRLCARVEERRTSEIGDRESEIACEEETGARRGTGRDGETPWEGGKESQVLKKHDTRGRRFRACGSLGIVMVDLVPRVGEPESIFQE
ncbi:hypothetical protein B0H17DRAFT_1137023 [Mycena rosella]|uniref:Uncharacterized protein n=1 Tax=Mycena rosella TaxID=1033263 RepID=A0AAD7GG17_MYCRO|nr:hypothetical protein B0H17DRAFT_1137023 [Mycena rosella]